LADTSGMTDGTLPQKTSAAAGLASVLKPTGVLTFLAAFTTWLMSLAFEQRTGLAYAWFSGTSIENLGRMVVTIALDFLKVLSRPLILIPTLLCLIGIFFVYRARRAGRDTGRSLTPLFGESTRNWLAIVIAATLLIVYVLPSTKIENQLTSSPLYTLNDKVSGYDVVNYLSHSYQRLQVCAAVGDLREKLADHHVTCSVSVFGARGLAESNLRTIYLGYFVGLAIIVGLAFPEIRRLTRVLKGNAEPQVSKPSSLTRVSAIVVLAALLAAPWVYVMLRADLAPRFGTIDGTVCRGYKIPAAPNRLVLYDPVEPDGSYEFDAALFKPEQGPRSDALSGFLAEQLSPRDLGPYEFCSTSKGSGKQ